MGALSPGIRDRDGLAALKDLEALERLADQRAAPGVGGRGQQGSASAGSPGSAVSSPTTLPTRSFMQDQEQWAREPAALGATSSTPLALSGAALSAQLPEAEPGATSGSLSPSSMTLVLRSLVSTVHSLPQHQLIRLCRVLQRLQEPVDTDAPDAAIGDHGHSRARSLAQPELLPELQRRLTAAVIKGLGVPADSSPQDLYIVLKVGQ